MEDLPDVCKPLREDIVERLIAPYMNNDWDGTTCTPVTNKEN